MRFRVPLLFACSEGASAGGATALKRAFSLIELLAVIAIIGTLAAILFPVFAKAKGAAEKASCLANLKELTLAGLIYAQDNDDRYFPFGYNVGPDYITWWGDLGNGDPKKSFLYPYTKSGQIRACPGAIELPNNVPYTFHMGYSMNFRLFYAYPPEPYTGDRTVSCSQIERPAETIYGGDAASWDPFRRTVIGNPWLFGDGWNSHLHARHAGDVANVAWLDGHATSQHLYYHVAPLGQYPYVVQPEDLKAFSLGDLLRFPREDPQAMVNSVRDQFYYLIQKPAGL